MAASPATNIRSLPRRQFQRNHIQNLFTLQKAAQKINSILDLDLLIARIVDDIAGWFGCLEANIYLRGEGADEMVLAAVHGCTLHTKGHRLKVGVEGMVGHAAGTGRMHYAPDVEKDPYYVGCEQNTRSEVAIPLKVEDRVIGVFTASHPEIDGFPPEQLRLLQAFAIHISGAIQNAQLFRQERLANERMNREAEEARYIQEALFPRSSPYVPGFVITGRCIPAGAVGGDWYDYIPLSNGRWMLVLADVAGKGMAAALLMAAARGMIRSLAETSSGPGEVLTRLNRLLLEDFPSGRFVTMLCAVFDPATRTLTFANAGHHWPLLGDASGVRTLQGDGGLPIGFAQETFAETRVSLPAGSRVVFYSDGITESENESGEEYGSQRLGQLLSMPDLSVETILEDACAFTAPSGARDDRTVILIKAD